MASVSVLTEVPPAVPVPVPVPAMVPEPGCDIGISTGSSAVTVKPPRGPGPAVRVPPAAARRSRRPVSPVPPPGAQQLSPPVSPSSLLLPSPLLPSSVTVSRTRSGVPETVIPQWLASLCRTTLVTASRTTQPSRAAVLGSGGGPDRLTDGSTPAAVRAERARSSSPARLPSR